LGGTTRGDGTLSSVSVRSGLNRQSSTPSLLSSSSKWDQQRSQSAMAHDDYLSSFATNGESSPMTTKSLHAASNRDARAVTAGPVRRSVGASAALSSSSSSLSWTARSSYVDGDGSNDTSSPIAPFIPIRSIAAKQSSIMAKSMRHSFSTGTVGNRH
jgi:hypothetical protein